MTWGGQPTARVASALVGTALVGTALATPAQAATTSAETARLRISVSPSTIPVGQAARVCVRTQPGEQVAVHAYTLPSRTYRLVRTGASASTLPCWTVRPRADTRLYASVIGGPASRSSASTVLQVRRIAAVCSATAPRFAHVDSAQCLYRAVSRGDRTTALHYAAPAVVAQLLAWRAEGVLPWSWSWSGCGEPLLLPAGGVSCFYDDATPVGVGHGVTIELGMSRAYRVTALETIG